MPKILDTPNALRPYIFHGVDLHWQPGDKEAIGDCPWCGREGKFSVSLETGKWKCWVCTSGGGNAYTFLRELWKLSEENTQDYSELVKDRGVQPDTLVHWEVVRSILTGDWMVPGYGASGRMNQLYAYKQREKRLLIPTPTLGHAMHGVNLYDRDKPTVYLCEGPWDGMALWEVLRETKEGDDGLAITANIQRSLLADANVLAIPGCGAVGKPFYKWLSLFAGKNVHLMFDNDHERVHPRTGKRIEPAGLDAMKRAAVILSEAKEPPLEINYLRWSERGFDPSLPSGYDVRDCLNPP